MDNILVMMAFTEILLRDPNKAFDFISVNGRSLNKDDILNIVKELLCSISSNTYDCNRDLYLRIMADTAIELDDIYESDYEEI